MKVPEVIVCPDCGGEASRISYEPHEGWSPGDVVAYRCRDCRDRWDVPFDEDEDEDEHEHEHDGSEMGGDAAAGRRFLSP